MRDGVAMIALLMAFQVAVAAPKYEREVVLTPEVREYLNLQWDDTRAGQVERGYCLIVQPDVRDSAPTDTVALVVGAFRAVAKFATPNRVSYWCGPKMIRLHVHTPTTCENGPQSCAVYGPMAFLCFPSLQDIMNTRSLEHEYGVIQCDRDGFITFYTAPGAGGVP